ncbi:MAG: hypothetical protein ACYDBB_23630 [Armatimonadota bacterium]
MSHTLGGMMILLPLLLVAFLLLGTEAAVAGEKKITVQEQLNRQWTHELLTYPFAAPQGQCEVTSVALTGPNGPLPVQLSDVQLWPGTQSVKSAQLSFFVEDLPPLTTQVYTVSFAAKAGTTPAITTDLQITKAENTIEVTTARFGARLLLGEKTYETPVSPADVLGPVAAMRLADGTWFGGSRLYGKTGIKSWSSTLAEAGPVFARVKTVYTYADGNTLTVTAQLAAGDYALMTEMNVAKDLPEDGWELLLNKGVSITDGVKITGSRGSYLRELPVKFDAQTKDACYLSPWTGEAWFPDSPAMVRLPLGGKAGELQLSIRDSGAWVTANPKADWINYAGWKMGMPDHFWTGWQSKRIPLLAADGGVCLRMNLLSGMRKWTLGQSADGKLLMDTYHHKATGAYTPMPRLNEVKEMVLDWKDGVKHPYLYLNAQEIAAAGVRNSAALKELQDLDKFKSIMNKLADYDLMRAVMDASARYDACIDSPQLTPQERKLLKAQMAYMAYMVADPFHWSYERGYMSGNPNMTTSRIANLGIAGFALRDNPQGKKWAQYAVDWTKYWLNEVVDEKGYWPESSHYARVSWADLVQLALVARKAGMHDFFTDPKFKAMAFYYEKTLTPPDPLRHAGNAVPTGVAAPHPRVNAPVGRGTRGDAWGLGGLVARATAVSDPAFSRIMQWSWRESGYNSNVSHGTAGMADLYVNRDLPAERPNWGSENFPHLGYLLRNNVGTPQENYLLFVSEYHRNADGEIWPADTGIISRWFANGTPIGGVFHRIPDVSHQLLESRVLLACNWDPAQGVGPDSGYVTKTSRQEFAPLPGADYVSAGFDITDVKPHGIVMPKDAPAFPKREKVGAAPLRWQRQMLLVKDDQPGSLTYLVLRDTVAGNQPTQWHFWTLSEKIGTPAQTADRAAFLADKPGNKTAPLRELQGNRFSALGQFGSDLEYYIAGPADTPRYTLRYGYTTGAYGVGNSFGEYMDLLHLQLPGDGSYFVAMFPHGQAEKAPEFTTLGNGTVIRLTGAFGTDYCFLTRDKATAKAGDAAFTGTAGTVQDRTTGLTLVLSAPGTVEYREFGLSSANPATLRIAPYALTLTLAENAPAADITLKAPGKWALGDGQTGVKLVKKGTAYVVTIPAGVRTVTLKKAL